MEETRKTYLPAAGRDWMLPLYDPLVKLLGGDAARRALLDQALIQPGHSGLDVGCGTGTLVVLIKRLHPDVNVIGLDPDPRALARARRMAAPAAVSAQFDQGFSDALPYTNASIDRVYSSFMFHHLQRVCSTISSVARNKACCGRCGASSDPVAFLTCWISADRNQVTMASWRA